MTEATITRKERDRLRREDDFLNAAEKLFSERGYFQTSMEDVAQEAEYATGTIYRYFPSKEELYNRMLIRKGRAFFDAVENSLRNCEGPMERLTSIIKSKVSFFFENTGFVKIYLSQVSASSNTITPPEGLRDAHEEYMRMIADILADGMKKGIFIKMDVEMLVLSFMGMTNHLLFSAVSQGKEIGEEEIERFVLGFLKKGLIKT